MTRKEQNKILDAKIESNVNQYKVDRMSAEISAFSSGDLNKYEFLTRKDLKYKPNARFQFSPLGQTFSTRLDKTAQGYQEEGVIKLLKDIKDSLARPPRPNNRPDDNENDNDDNDDDDNNDDDDDDDDKISEYQEFLSPLLEEINNKKYTNDDNDDDDDDEQKSDDKVFDVLNEFKNNMENKMSDLDKMVKSKEDEWNTKLNKLNNDAKKICNYIKKNNVKKELDIVEKNVIIYC